MYQTLSACRTFRSCRLCNDCVSPHSTCLSTKVVAACPCRECPHLPIRFFLGTLLPLFNTLLQLLLRHENPCHEPTLSRAFILPHSTLQRLLDAVEFLTPSLLVMNESRGVLLFAIQEFTCTPPFIRFEASHAASYLLLHSRSVLLVSSSSHHPPRTLLVYKQRALLSSLIQWTW